MHYDVAIIGTGPAGGMAALELSKSGLDVVVLEKKQLPRLKPCGGLMGAGVKRLFDWDFSELIELEVSSILHLHNFNDPHEEHREENSLLLVNRARFDSGLLKHAIDQSNGRITLKTNFLAGTVTEFDDRVEIASSNDELITANFLIAADGVTSKTARCLSLNQDRKQAVAIDAEIEVTHQLYKREKHRLTFNFFCIPAGYGWIFPKKENTLSCGIASWGKIKNIKNYLDQFIDQSLGSLQVFKIEEHGFPIPIYSGNEEIATRRVCLVGDAASLVDPIIGEGILYALLSGKFAAETILETNKNPELSTPGLAAYQEKVRKIITPNLELKNRFLSLSYHHAPDYFYKNIVKGLKGYNH